MPRLNPVRLVAIYGHTHQGPENLRHISRLLELLRERGIAIMTERVFACYLTSEGVSLMPSEVTGPPPSGAGAAISIGGDGTFLRTARWIGRRQIPVLGINTGHLGFLASYTPAESAELVEMLYTGHADVQERTALRVDTGAACATPPDLPYALNEVAILKEETASMLNVHVDLSGHYLADYLADGLLISTPTGSTGYSLSVG
ncbi:MAG: NAD(+)/NADH kinase, partial [Muribaculaceae bacterium]|nr:NAD(+)/NADH kinase [Muribaculaceae bacterium]